MTVGSHKSDSDDIGSDVQIWRTVTNRCDETTAVSYMLGQARGPDLWKEVCRHPKVGLVPFTDEQKPGCWRMSVDHDWIDWLIWNLLLTTDNTSSQQLAETRWAKRQIKVTLLSMKNLENKLVIIRWTCAGTLNEDRPYGCTLRTHLNSWMTLGPCCSVAQGRADKSWNTLPPISFFSFLLDTLFSYSFPRFTKKYAITHLVLPLDSYLKVVSYDVKFIVMTM